MKRTKNKQTRSAQASSNTKRTVHKAPFIEHIYELRRRLFTIALSVIIFSVAAYFVQHFIVRALLAPAGDQHFAQTTPGGGLDFLFRICLYTGITLSVPVIVHQLLKYLEPLIRKDAVRFIRQASIASWFLAIGGVAFGYFIGLPAALHFLLHQFSNPQIETLISLQSYLSFVMIYLVGAAMLFQIPLIMLVVNRIKPLKPSKLFQHERWVILFAVIAGGVLSPSPNIMDQILLAGPMIATYQLGIALVWFANRKVCRPKRVMALLEKDKAARQARLEQFEAARAALLAETRKRHASATILRQTIPQQTALAPSPTEQHIQPHTPVSPPAPTPRRMTGRPTRYLREFQRRSYLAPQPSPLRIES